MHMTSPDTSLSLLQQARQADSDTAWNRLVPLYTGLLQSWFRAAGLQPADGDDLTQRALEVLLRRLGTFQHSGRRGAFRTWLRGIAVNLLREFWRRRPTADLASVLDQLVDPRGGLSRLWDEEHEHHVLQGLLELVRPEFTPTTWQAFRRQALDGAAARTVAAELGQSVNAVLISKSRVLARLRREAAGLLDDSPMP
jgi:RNA polymerase sigma-70 factor (ECF subfamily)